MHPSGSGASWFFTMSSVFHFIANALVITRNFAREKKKKVATHTLDAFSGPLNRNKILG